MGQTDLGDFSDDDEDDSARERLEERLLHMTREVLPDMAVPGEWPVHYDHCFGRIAYDNACEGQWDTVVEGKPFYSEAPDALVNKALNYALRMRFDGKDYVAKLNEKSLLYRGEIEPEDCEHIDGEFVLQEANNAQSE